MKKAVFSIIILTIVIILVPFLTIYFTQEDNSIKSYNQEDNANTKDNNFIFYNGKEDKLTTLSEYDFLLYKIACDIPITYHKESLKAIAITYHTYYSFLAQNNEPFTLENEIFTSKEDLQEFYKEDYENNIKFLDTILNETFNTFITYENKIIYSPFSDFCAGITENNTFLNLEDYTYIKSIASPYDLYAPNFSKTISMTPDEVKEVINNNFENVNLSDNYSNWFTDIKKTESGNVISLKVGEKTISGVDFQKAFNFDSACFDVLYTLENFNFTIKGKGSFLGLSLYGSNEMAKLGFNYKEIINHYFYNVEISLKN